MMERTKQAIMEADEFGYGPAQVKAIRDAFAAEATPELMNLARAFQEIGTGNSPVSTPAPLYIQQAIALLDPKVNTVVVARIEDLMR